MFTLYLASAGGCKFDALINSGAACNLVSDSVLHHVHSSGDVLGESTVLVKMSYSD
jgi:hypothetical protein